MTEHIDPHTGLVTEIVPVEVAPAQAQGMTLFGSDDPAQAMQRMREVATLLRAEVEAQKLYVEIPDKKGGPPKKHVIIEGWTLLGSMVGTFARQAACDPVLSNDGGLLGFKAQCELVTRGGQVVGQAFAFCMKSESRGPWKYSDDYALASMAQTRAASKAQSQALRFVMKMAGFETVPSDEVPPGGFPDGPVRTIAPGVTGSQDAKAGPQAQGSAAPTPEPKAEPKAPPAPAVDFMGRPTIPEGQEYHECPSCHGATVRVNPTTGEAYCWKRANGCGATFTKKLWDVVSVTGPSSTDPPPRPARKNLDEGAIQLIEPWPDQKEADAVVDLTEDLPF